ncbi:phytochromobilin:ferredoxin oxidoreductase, chloroplastic isoform X1 [Actinidia eriantha]|uniref:phytochromobilin:ferredoxin oxidoreductase, chloroplastic isoform X1 n=1 Tax=Actinidia eriantha TaxID=165200 RepID=UPI00258ED609|nr:phytochromobilin:ferredoxin oxidoreductase, chloroplastic isoform X1 [Actinidia eriantha]
MESSISLSFFPTLSKTPLLYRGRVSISLRRSDRRSMRPIMEVSGLSYQKFVHFALDETKRRTHLIPSPLQDQFSSSIAMDGKTELQTLSFQAPKIRLLRSLCTEGNETMKVLDFAVFPKPEFDLPIFCANFFATASMNIVVLDLNPLHDVVSRRDYKEKYYNSLMPLGLRYAELFPWGGKITSESLRFFSPIVIWTKFRPSQYNHNSLYSAFMDYYKAWLDLMDHTAEETNASQIEHNCVAQHRYLTWRAEKDPGYRVLEKLIGEDRAKDLLKNFLFNGIDDLGRKTFLDYFPEYRCKDGAINEKRSIVGKSFEHRPWDARGEFVGNNHR